MPSFARAFCTSRAKSRSAEIETMGIGVVREAKSTSFIWTKTRARADFLWEL